MIKFVSVAGQWFSPGSPVSSINNTDRHDTTEILLKVALNTTTLPPIGCEKSGRTKPRTSTSQWPTWSDKEVSRSHWYGKSGTIVPILYTPSAMKMWPYKRGGPSLRGRV